MRKFKFKKLIRSAWRAFAAIVEFFTATPKMRRQIEPGKYEEIL